MKENVGRASVNVRGNKGKGSRGNERRVGEARGYQILLISLKIH